MKTKYTAPTQDQRSIEDRNTELVNMIASTTSMLNSLLEAKKICYNGKVSVTLEDLVSIYSETFLATGWKWRAMEEVESAISNGRKMSFCKDNKGQLPSSMR